MVKGNKAKEVVFSKKIGFGLFKLLGFNPETKEDIARMGFYTKEDGKDPVYLDEVEGHERVRLDFYMQEVNDYKYKETFFLENIPSLSKELEDKDQPRKKEFINATGQTSWVFEETELSEKFKSYDYHHAVKGESLLIDFLKKLMNLEWKAEISYNFKKFFNNHFKELKDDLSTAESIIIPLTIKQEDVPDTDEIKEYQHSFKAYAKGSEYKFVNLKGVAGWSEDDIDAIKERDSYNKELFQDRKRGEREGVKAKWINDIDKVVLKMLDDNYGCKNVFFLGKIKDYDGESLPSTGNVIDTTTADWK